MSIIIHGLDMPKRKHDVLYVKIFPNGGINWWNALGDSEIARTQKGKAEQLPPHGRLIDADAFKYEECGSCDGFCERCDGYECSMCRKECRCDFMKAFDEAPTIIEAEEEEKER